MQYTTITLPETEAEDRHYQPSSQEAQIDAALAAIQTQAITACWDLLHAVLSLLLGILGIIRSLVMLLCAGISLVLWTTNIFVLLVRLAQARIVVHTSFTQGREADHGNR